MKKGFDEDDHGQSSDDGLPKVDIYKGSEYSKKPKKKMNMSVLPNSYKPNLMAANNLDSNLKSMDEPASAGRSRKTKNQVNMAKSVIPGAGQFMANSRKSTGGG